MKKFWFILLSLGLVAVFVTAEASANQFSAVMSFQRSALQPFSLGAESRSGSHAHPSGPGSALRKCRR